MLLASGSAQEASVRLSSTHRCVNDLATVDVPIRSTHRENWGNCFRVMHRCLAASAFKPPSVMKNCLIGTTPVSIAGDRTPSGHGSSPSSATIDSAHVRPDKSARRCAAERAACAPSKIKVQSSQWGSRRSDLIRSLAVPMGVL